MEIKYNIWHIDGYVGWDDYDGPSDCNTHIDYIIGAKFTKEDVIDTFCNENKNIERWLSANVCLSLTV